MMTGAITKLPVMKKTQDITIIRAMRKRVMIRAITSSLPAEVMITPDMNREATSRAVTVRKPILRIITSRSLITRIIMRADTLRNTKGQALRARRITIPRWNVSQR